MLGEEATRNGLGDCVAEILVAFYIDDGLIASCNPVWLQASFNVLVGLFERIGLFTNATKTKAMVCISGQIQEGYTKEEYADYKSQTETAANQKRRRVDCEICGTSLAAGSYQSHLESQHDVFHSMVLQQDLVVECLPVIYRAIKLIAAGAYYCLVPQHVGEASTKWALRRHFPYRHPQNLVVIPSKGRVPFPKCKRCDLQTKVGALYRRHQHTWLCRERWERRMKHEATEAARIALAKTFMAYGEDLEKVEVFKYPGSLLAYNNDDSQAMQSNLKKAHRAGHGFLVC
jgi:hypothetical protein